MGKLFTRILLFWVRLLYPKVRVEGAENLPDEPFIAVGNHAKMNGPIMGELYFPVTSYIWCTSEMMDRREVPDYAYRDFWSRKPKALLPFFRALSYCIAPLASALFNNTNCIPVYHDVRVMGTFKETVQKLQSGASVIIFPEHDVPYNGILWEFQDHFIDVARLYYKKTGAALCFVPMYVAPRLHKLILGAPIRFDPAAPLAQERARICRALMDGVTALARGQEAHIVVPYPNIPKRDYPMNKETVP